MQHSLEAKPIRDLYHEPARLPPSAEEDEALHNSEGDEIDRELAGYFENLKNSVGLNVDDDKLEELFEKERQKEKDSEETIRFSNINPDRSGTGDEEEDPLLQKHTVVKGDTIWSIGKRYGVTPQLIIKHNPDLASRPLYIGDEILIYRANPPEVKSIQRVIVHKIRRGETLSHLSQRYNVSLRSLYRWNGLSSRSVLQIGQSVKIYRQIKKLPAGYSYRPFFIWPIHGRLTSGFGRRYNPFVRSRRQFHKGLDIGVPIGTPFRAARDGIVVHSGRTGGYGNAIFIRHTNGYMSIYAHNKVNLVKKGDVVKQGQIIGQVGRTGTATGPHLHFEVRKWKQAINPLSALHLKEVVPVSGSQVTASRVP